VAVDKGNFILFYFIYSFVFSFGSKDYLFLLNMLVQANNYQQKKMYKIILEDQVDES